MNRTLDQVAALLGLGPNILRRRMRELKILNQGNELIAAPQHEGRLFMDPRSRWCPTLRTYRHYAVVKVTERGVQWLAKQLNVEITPMPPRGADQRTGS
ncbi:hypothetical protein [Pseudomonas oryzihabitans]|uniref:hypothetical protein n=1 Tax=Pseudomonas oryzihabitans TaxID=47885 RepID=UPI0028951EC2|nr:hypothetical protein [Pseudomonas oryzihabitans]MDT3720326.1 hypothetical protein [Pseudomonas oryzihabitans]